LAACAILAGCHTEAGINALVNAASRAKTGCVNCVGNRRPIPQLAPQGLKPPRLQKLTWSQTDDSFELFLEMERAHPNMPGDDFQRQGFLVARTNEGNSFLNARGIKVVPAGH
jgi:hypothetical protein